MGANKLHSWKIEDRTLLELEIILSIFHLLKKLFTLYIYINIFQTSSSQQSSNMNLYPLLMSRNTSSYFILWLLYLQSTNGFSIGLVCNCEGVCECRWKFLQVSKTVWRLSSNTWTHKSSCHILCQYQVMWWLQLEVDSSIMSIIFTVRNLTERDLPDFANDIAVKI